MVYELDSQGTPVYDEASVQDGLGMRLPFARLRSLPGRQPRHHRWIPIRVPKIEASVWTLVYDFPSSASGIMS